MLLVQDFGTVSPLFRLTLTTRIQSLVQLVIRIHWYHYPGSESGSATAAVRLVRIILFAYIVSIQTIYYLKLILEIYKLNIVFLAVA